ncbi:MAG TPA: toluene tolerance protein [Cellvibrio sp.]|nr:toluene tolerance protein [Cellvibrio sp.]
MNKIIKSFVAVPVFFSAAVYGAIVYCLIVSGIAMAAPAQDDPYKVVQHTTEQVLDIIKGAKADYKKDPQKFNQQVTVLLEEVIDFDKFARGVMGRYASGQHYNSLTSEAEKTAFKQQIKSFSATFKRGIVDTYAKGLFDFNGQNIKTMPSRKGDDAESGAVTVMQNIYNASGKPYVIQYSMRRNKNGEWKLNNLIVEGINLGLTYRNQFAVSADRYKGDIDKVIANWQVDPKVAALKSSAPKKEPVN